MHSEYDFLQDRNNELEHENSMLHEQVTELQDDNMSLMDKCETLESGLPHPVTFDGKRSTSEYTLRGWLAKLKEEVSEVEAEVDKVGNITPPDLMLRTNTQKEEMSDDLSEELTDVITVCASTLNWLGWTIYGRAQLQKKVNEKNRKRGYWE
jgi:NTP pyrophosphatase (non-canonical NTP hydrolase)